MRVEDTDAATVRGNSLTPRPKARHAGTGRNTNRNTFVPERSHLFFRRLQDGCATTCNLFEQHVTRKRTTTGTMEQWRQTTDGIERPSTERKEKKRHCLLCVCFFAESQKKKENKTKKASKWKR